MPNQPNGLRWLKITSLSLAVAATVGGAVWTVAVWAQERERVEMVLAERHEKHEQEDQNIHAQIAATQKGIAEILDQLTAESRKKQIEEATRERCRQDPESCGIR